jgi:1-deoxy-D-xylulose-5-phosphate reductoisomerase
MNAANEEAVELFLSGSIRFTDIARLIEETLEELGGGAGVTIDELMHADELARRRVKELAGQRIH